MTALHKKQLRLIGTIIVLGTLLILEGWVLASSWLNLEVVQTCRFAGMSVMLLLIASFLAPLFLHHAYDQRLRGWVIVWFVGSLAFDAFWEIPLWTIPAISEASHTVENLPWAII